MLGHNPENVWLDPARPCGGMGAWVIGLLSFARGANWELLKYG